MSGNDAVCVWKACLVRNSSARGRSSCREGNPRGQSWLQQTALLCTAVLLELGCSSTDCQGRGGSPNTAGRSWGLSLSLFLSPVSLLIWFVLVWFKSMDWRMGRRLNMKTLQNKRNARWVLKSSTFVSGLFLTKSPMKGFCKERENPGKRLKRTQTSQFHFSTISHVSAPHLLLPCISVMKQTPQPSHKQLKSSTASPSLDTLVNSSPWGTKQLFCSPFQCLWWPADAG